MLTGMSGAVQRTAGYSRTTVRSDRLLYCYCTQIENNGIRGAYNERLHCENAFMMGSSNASLARNIAHAHLSHSYQ